MCIAARMCLGLSVSVSLQYTRVADPESKSQKKEHYKEMFKIQVDKTILNCVADGF